METDVSLLEPLGYSIVTAPLFGCEHLRYGWITAIWWASKRAMPHLMTFKILQITPHLRTFADWIIYLLHRIKYNQWICWNTSGSSGWLIGSDEVARREAGLQCLFGEVHIHAFSIAPCSHIKLIMFWIMAWSESPSSPLGDAQYLLPGFQIVWRASSPTCPV